MRDYKGLTRRDFLATTGSTALGLGVGGAAIGLGRGAARAQNFPTRAITWIIYQAPGGSIDVTSRLVQPYLAEQGIETRLEYVQGAGGRIARTQLYNERPDGYTIITESSPSGALGEIVFDAAYKTLEFEPIYGWNLEGWQLCVRKDSPIRTFSDFVEETKKRDVTVASIGRGGASHLQIVVMQSVLNLNFNIVHFTGTGQAYPQVIGGHVDVVCGGPGSGSRNREQLHFIGVFRETGEPALPEVPTLEAQGYDVPSMNQIWYAMTTPNVPEDRLDRLEAAFKTAFDNPKHIEEQKKAGMLSLTMMDRAQLINEVKAGYEVALAHKEFFDT